MGAIFNAVIPMLIGSVLFATLSVGAFAVSPRWRVGPAWRSNLLVVWAIAHLVVGGPLAVMSHEILTACLLGTIVTAAVMIAATGSWIPLAGCVLAVVVEMFHDSSSPDGPTEQIIEWNICVAAGMWVWMGWAWRRSRSRPDCCERCGYSLVGLSGGTCPECGSTAGPEGESATMPAQQKGRAHGTRDLGGGEGGKERSEAS